jgi:hypothetical protein
VLLATPGPNRLTPGLRLVVALLCVASCGSNLRVTGIHVGRALNPDHTVANHTTSFAPEDTVYVSVFTSGVGSGTLSVRWTYAGRVLDEPQKKVSYRDVAATDFSLRSVAGFPTGQYTAEVFLDGISAGTRTFRVDAR